MIWRKKLNMVIKVMVVDDEPHIRKILQTVITRNPAFEVVAGCDNMTDALIQFNDKKPQVVFMDIEIKDSSGVDCAKVMSQLNPDIKIIFATAHSEYMANAFELYAFDYLVKPFDMKRIEHTLEKLERTMLIESPSDMGASHKESTESTDDDKKGKILIKGKEVVSFVDVDDIIFIERLDSATHIYTKNKEDFVTSMSLAEFEEKLDENTFIRSHKSFIINITMIKRVEQYGRWTYSVYFKGIDKDALITKEKYDQIKNMYE